MDLPTAPETTYMAFTDPAVYSRWLQVPVTIHNGAFAATLEWGTEVRGRYEFVLPPHLIVMSWDFEDGNVPVPGHLLTGYLRIRDQEAGSRVDVHQLTDTAEQASFMEAAWSMVLGRLKANILAAIDPAADAGRRPTRPKSPAGTARAAHGEFPATVSGPAARG